MSSISLGPGKIVTASFEDGNGFTDQDCIDNECHCECHDGSPRPEGIYVTIRLDDPNASVGIARVKVELEDADDA